MTVTYFLSGVTEGRSLKVHKKRDVIFSGLGCLGLYVCVLLLN